MSNYRNKKVSRSDSIDYDAFMDASEGETYEELSWWADQILKADDPIKSSYGDVVNLDEKPGFPNRHVTIRLEEENHSYKLYLSESGLGNCIYFTDGLFSKESRSGFILHPDIKQHPDNVDIKPIADCYILSQ